MSKRSYAFVLVVAVVIIVAAVAAHQRGGRGWMRDLGAAIHGRR